MMAPGIGQNQDPNGSILADIELATRVGVEPRQTCIDIFAYHIILAQVRKL